MKRLTLGLLLSVTLALVVAPFAFAATAAPAARGSDRSPAAPLATVISTVTGSAISPLVGTGAYGAYQWAMAKEEARAALPWYAQWSFFGPALAIVGLCAVKDAMGAAVPPGLKKPLDIWCRGKSGLRAMGVWRDARGVNLLSLRPGRGWWLFGLFAVWAAEALGAAEQRLLYVAVPGIRNYLEYGGHGVLVFDIDRGHALVKRLPARGLGADGKPLNVKGIVASAVTKRLYVSTLQFLTCFDLATDQILWEKSYEGGCDRMALSPDGQVMYLPSLEKDHWHVINALTGEVLTKVVPKSGAHNTLYGPDGAHAYLAGLKSPFLRVTDTATHTISKEVGPFGSAIRPFTINGRQTLAFVNVNGLLGFEVGDLVSGKLLHRVEVQGFAPGVPKRHGCPSHGIGLTPNEKEVWVCDAVNQRLHIFDATVMPPKQVASVAVRDQPGWITFSLDGKLAYPSTGEVIDVATRKIVATLADETGAAVHSEKLLEIDFAGGQPVRAGDQFGIGRVVK